MTDPITRGDYQKIGHFTAHLAEGFDNYVNDPPDGEPVDFLTGMMAVLNLAKRVALETEKQTAQLGTAPAGHWRRLFVINFLRMMSDLTWDTQDPLIAELVGLPTDEFWTVIEDLVADD